MTMLTRALLQKYREGKCTPQELEILKQYFEQPDLPELENLLESEWDEDSDTRPTMEGQASRGRILKSLKEEIESEVKSIPSGNTRLSLSKTFRRSCMGAAACIFLLAGIFLFWKNTQPGPAVAVSKHQIIIKRNDSAKPLAFHLPDGSAIILQPGSSLTFPKKFEEGKRFVKLDGIAFFDVAKDSLQPFFVSTRTLLVRVLGTSFKVLSQENKPAEVAVLSGKVAVFSRERKETVVLKPNERVIRLNENSELKKILVTEPVPVREELGEVFHYDETPAAKVFESISKAYDIRIRYDAEVLKNCTLRARLGNQPLFVKLDMICSSLGLEYQVVGTEILVQGRGCEVEIDQ